MASISAPLAAPAAAGPKPRKRWSVGTLTYTTPQLVNVFVWMLWGDFCLFLMDSGVGRTLVPLQLKKFGASNATIAIINKSLVEFLVLFLCPIISTWSDRYRSGRGRRIPFMLWTTPPLAVCLALLGFSPDIAAWLKSISPHLLGGISAAGLTVALITITLVGYKFFDTFPQSVYYYLYTDVIPPQFMGTFVCLFRVCSTLGVLVFNKFLLKYCDNHPAAICTIAAALYCVAFLLLCVLVKEGQYPPPEPAPQGPIVRRSITSVARFCRECFTHPFYWKYYLLALCFMIGYVPFGDFLIFFGQKELKMDLASYGNVMAMKDVVQIVVFLCLGPIVDRLHPLRMGMIGITLVVATGVCSFIFIHTAATFTIWVLITFGAVAMYQGATGALGPRLLPRTHYGQFCAASALVFHFGQMFLAPLLGWITDKWGNAAVFPWFFTFCGGASIFLFLVYRDWKKLGGDAGYVPPLTTLSRQEQHFETVTAH